MSFNIGYFMAVKTSGTGGGVLSIDDITGAGHTAGRGLPPRGSTVAYGTLPIYNPHSSSSILTYPTSTKFSARGIAIIQFLYDHSAIPHTVSGPGGILATPCRYSIGAISGHSSSNVGGLLLHFSNVGDFNRASPHFSTPSVPIPRIQDVIDDATAMARRLAAIINPMSRPTMAGLVVV